MPLLGLVAHEAAAVALYGGGILGVGVEERHMAVGANALCQVGSVAHMVHGLRAGLWEASVGR